MENLPFNELATNVSFGLILLYLTFRIFKILDAIVGKISSVQIVVVVGDQQLPTSRSSSSAPSPRLETISSAHREP